MRHILLAAATWVSAGCGLTIGVDAIEEVTEAQHSAEGVTLVRASDLAVRNNIRVTGEGESITAAVATTRWSNGDASEDSIQVALEESGPELSLAIRGSSETTSLDYIGLQLASGVGLSLEVVSGAFEARNLDAEIYVKSSSFVRFDNCSGAIRVDAPTAGVAAITPVDVDGSNTVDAQLRAGGFITAKQISAHLEAVEGDLLASTQVAGGGFITLYAPRNTPFTLVLRAKERIFIDLGDYTFDSSDPERPDDGLSIVDGITVDIAGGGPQIDLAAETNIFVYEIAN